MTGLCAYALAFSTLLSSQGADAHRHKAFAWIGGNPLSLPARSRAVKRFRETLTTSQPLCTASLPCRRRCDVRTSCNKRGIPCWAPGTGAPTAFRPCLGAGRNIRHTCQLRQIERARATGAQVSGLRIIGLGSGGLRLAGDQFHPGHRAPAPAEHEEPVV